MEECSEASGELARDRPTSTPAVFCWPERIEPSLGSRSESMGSFCWREGGEATHPRCRGRRRSRAICNRSTKLLLCPVCLALSFSLPSCPHMHPSSHPSSHPPTYPPSIYPPSTHLPTIHPFIDHLFIHPSCIHLCTHPPINHPFIYPFIIYLFIQ